MKSRFFSRRLVGSLMLSMAGVFALSALPAQAQAATQEEAVVKQLQKVISKCLPFKTWGEREAMINRLKQIGFRETLNTEASRAPVSFLVMEREMPISLLGHPTQKLVFSVAATGDEVSSLTISAVFPKSSFNALKKYRRGNAEKDDFFITVRQAEDGVYLSCIGHISDYGD